MNAENKDHHEIEHPDGADSPRQPAQGEMPFAVVGGEAITELPQDLYIPPDALEVFLEAF
ncbi:MAG: segregation/condensation protein A, partial [Acidiferrobacterales bacterium]